MKRERRIALFVIIIVAAFVLAGVVAYFSLRGRSKDGITLQKGVIELAEKDYSDVSIEDNQLRLSGSGAKKAKEGDIIIFQVLDNGAKTARRITGISSDGIASLEKPAYEEVIKEVNFDETIPITFEDFLAGFDVIEETDDTEAGIEGTQYPHVASKKIDAGFMPPIFFDTLGQVDAGEIGLNLKYERDNGEATISLAIYHNGRRVEVAPPTSMPDLTERDLSHAKGSLDIDIKMRDLKVAGHYQTLGGHRSWFNMDGTYEMDVNGSLGMEWEVPLGHGIPVASALGFVEIEITPMLIIRADGTVSLEMWTSFDGKVEYSDFTGFEYEKHIGDRGFEIEGHVRFYGGLRAKASFTLLWDIAIVIDAGVDILTEVDVGSHPRDSGMICLDVDIYSPIVEIFVSFGPIENPIASDKLTLVDKNNKLVKHDHFHYEKYRNGTGDFIQVKKCTYKEAKEEEEEEEEEKEKTVDFGEIYMDAVQLHNYIGFETVTDDFITYTPEPGGDEYLNGSIDGVDCVTVCLNDMSSVEYFKHVDGYTLCGVYPGQKVKEAQEILKKNGFTYFDSDQIYTFYSIPSETPDVYYHVAYTVKGDCIDTVSIVIWMEGAA